MEPQVQQENETQAPTDEQDGPKLSTEEKDLNERPFVLAKDETTTFGMIGAESGLTEAPIKLSQGENSTDESGRNHGYGLLHIEASHGDEIRAAGYSSVVEFVENVAKNYTDIREGAKIGDKQTYLLEVSDEHNNTLFVELSKDGSYWNVNSAGIFRKKYSRRKPKVHTVPAVGGGTVTDTPEVNSGQNEGATAPAGNSPWASEGKDTVSLEEKQGEEEKSSAHTEWDALVESYAGDEFTREEAAEMAQDHVAAEIDAAKKRLAAASKIKQGKNESTQDWIKRKRRAQKQAEADIASWEAMGKVPGQRQAQAEAERKAAEERAEAEEALGRLLDNFDTLAWSRARRGRWGRIGEGVQKMIIGEKGASSLDARDEARRRMEDLDTAREMERRYKEIEGSEEHQRMVEAAEKVRGLKAVEVQPHTMDREQQKAMYQGFKRATNRDTGLTVEFFGSAFEKNHRDGGLFEKAIPGLKAAFEDAVRISSEADNRTGEMWPDGSLHKEHRSVQSFDDYIGKVKIDGKEYYVRYTVQVQKGQNGIHSQFVSNIDLYDTTNPTEVASYRDSSLAARLDFDGIVDAKLRNFFMLASDSQLNFARRLKYATGWERGADGKWRYEVPDGKWPFKCKTI